MRKLNLETWSCIGGHKRTQRNLTSKSVNRTHHVTLMPFNYSATELFPQHGSKSQF